MRPAALALLGCLAATAGCIDRNESEYDTEYVIPPGVSLDAAPPMTGGLEQPGSLPADAASDTVAATAAPAADTTAMPSDTAGPGSSPD